MFGRRWFWAKAVGCGIAKTAAKAQAIAPHDIRLLAAARTGLDCTGITFFIGRFLAGQRSENARPGNRDDVIPKRRAVRRVWTSSPCSVLKQPFFGSLHKQQVVA